MDDAIYEPDGNVPPDFSCKGIAIEARRLNQHDGDGRGLDVSAIPLAMKFRRVLESMGPPGDSSWFVTYRYRRPLEHWAKLRPKIEDALKGFVGASGGPVSLQVTENFALRLGKSDRPLETRYVFGGYSDHDAGGWIVSELIRNLNIVIPEKSDKVARFRGKYQQWWLALVDHIANARLDRAEIELLRHHVVRPPSWAKIILLNPLVPESSIEL